MNAAMRVFRTVLATVPLYATAVLAQQGAMTGAVGETQAGLAAVYSNRLNGHRTASGERYNKNALTAAHQTLPFGTKVKVTRIKNGKSVVVRINDRGPTQAGRIVDLSQHAAQSLGMHKSLAQVKLEVVAAAGAKKHKTIHKTK